MSYTVTITENSKENESTERVRITVDHLSISEVLKAINTPPKKPRADKGIARGPKATPAATV